MRPRDRGGARGPRGQAGAVRAPVRGLPARRGARHEHLLPAGDRARDAPPSGRSGWSACTSSTRSALMDLLEVVAGVESSPEAIETALRGRRADGQARDRRARRPRLPRQPLRAAVRPGGAEAAGRGRGEPRVDRPHRAHGRRLPDGAVRAHGPGRDRRRLRGLEVLLGAELPRAALATEHDPGAHGPGRAAGPQGRPRLLRLRPERRRHRPEDPDPPPAGRCRASSRSRARAGSPTTCATPPRRPGTTCWTWTVERRRAADPRSTPSPAARRSTSEPMIDDPDTLVLRPVRRRQPGRARHPGRRGRLPRPAPVRRVAARRADPRRARRRDRDARRAEQFFRSLGKHVEWVGDAPGLVLGRIVCQLVNEAAFAVTEGVGVARGRRHRDAPRLQLSARPARVGRPDRARPRAGHARRAPRGAGEERYRAAPLLRRMVAEGRLGEATGSGFFEYD